MGGHQEGETLPHQEANYRPSGPIPPGPSMDLLLQSLKQESGWGSAKYRTEYTRCKWLTCLHMVQRPSHIKRNNTGLIRKQQASSLWTGLPTSSVPILTHMNATVCVCAETKGQLIGVHFSPFTMWVPGCQSWQKAAIPTELSCQL